MNWEEVKYNTAAKTAKDNPYIYYYSKIYSYRYGINQLKDARTFYVAISRTPGSGLIFRRTTVPCTSAKRITGLACSAKAA